MYNLLKMERYQLLRNRVYQVGMLAVFLVGYVTADSYEPEWGGPNGGAAGSLADIFNAMIYDFTLPMVILCGLLALLLGQEFDWRTLNREVCAGHGRAQIFASKTLAYLLAFNFMAMLYPIAGCIREYAVFGPGDAVHFWFCVGKGTLYSLLLNSACFMTAVFFCCWLRCAAPAMACAAGFMFFHGLCYAYGMLWGISAVSVLPVCQIRVAVVSEKLLQPLGILVAAVWIIALTAASWRLFRKCDLK